MYEALRIDKYEALRIAQKVFDALRQP